MRTALFLLAFVAIPTFAAQTVWKWVDERGVTHYSDRPVPGATRVELSTATRGVDFGDPQASPASASSSPDAAEPAAGAYRTLEIWKPGEGESIVNTGGQVTVNVRVEPTLRRGHSLYLYLDGRLVEGLDASATTFDLKDVPRGEHRVIAVVNNERGARIQETAPVSFFVRQESVANPPVGPALRPPPKPRGASNKPTSDQPSYAALNGARPAIDPKTNAPVRGKPAAKPGPRPGG